MRRTLGSLAVLVILALGGALGVLNTADASGHLAPAAARVAALAPGEAGRGMGYGAAFTGPPGPALDRIESLGFGWIKYNLSWAGAQAGPGAPPAIAELQDVVQQARQRNIQVLIRVHEAPGWAAHPRCRGGISQPPAPENLPHMLAFLQKVAFELRGQVTAYEIWNEPNTGDEWGGCPANPYAFTEMMLYAYAGVKAGDPNALVISGGLSNTGNGPILGVCDGVSVSTCGDLLFLQRAYEAGAKTGTHWDGIGAHPYGGDCAPSSPFGTAAEGGSCASNVGLYFRRLDDMRNIIRDFGVPRGESPTVPIWSTEMGWVSDFGKNCFIGSKDHHKVSHPTQAAYYRQAFEYAQANMPNIGPIFTFLIDHNIGFGPDCGSMLRENWEFRWYSAFTERAQRNLLGDQLAVLVKAPPIIQGQNLTLFLKKGTQVSVPFYIINRNGAGDRWALTNQTPWLRLSSNAGTLLSWQTATLTATIDVPKGPPGTEVMVATIPVIGYGVGSTSAPAVATITVYAIDDDPPSVYIPKVDRTTPAGW